MRRQADVSTCRFVDVSMRLRVDTSTRRKGESPFSRRALTGNAVDDMMNIVITNLVTDILHDILEFRSDSLTLDTDTYVRT